MPKRDSNQAVFDTSEKQTKPKKIIKKRGFINNTLDIESIKCFDVDIEKEKYYIFYSDEKNINLLSDILEKIFNIKLKIMEDDREKYFYIKNIFFVNFKNEFDKFKIITNEKCDFMFELDEKLSLINNTARIRIKHGRKIGKVEKDIENEKVKNNTKDMMDISHNIKNDEIEEEIRDETSEEEIKDKELDEETEDEILEKKEELDLNALPSDEEGGRNSQPNNIPLDRKEIEEEIRDENLEEETENLAQTNIPNSPLGLDLNAPPSDEEAIENLAQNSSILSKDLPSSSSNSDTLGSSGSTFWSANAKPEKRESSGDANELESAKSPIKEEIEEQPSSSCTTTFNPKTQGAITNIASGAFQNHRAAFFPYVPLSLKPEKVSNPLSAPANSTYSSHSK